MRNRYLDLLRAAAIVRVIVYHLFGWPWLSIVLPAMGVMFALAGSLTAASLEKRPAGEVITSRLRRLLPPLWLLGLIAVPVMIVAGWRQETDGEHPFSAARLLLWVLPVGDPPGSDLGIDAWEPLWYIRAYVWFVLLSPALFAFYRRAGWLAVASPILLLGLLDVTGFSLPDTADAALWDFVTYGACWVAGFAHHDGRLARLKPWLAVPLAVGLGAAALYWLQGHQGEDPWDLNDVSESQALWSIAFVLLALRWQPPMGWLARARPLDRTVTLLNNRAVTVYLWHNIAIAAVWPVLTVLALDDSTGAAGAALDLLTALTLTVVAVLTFGWTEDLAARRHPRLWPTTTPDPQPSATPEPAASTPAPPAFTRRPSAAAAVNRLPASWPPHPHTGTPSGHLTGPAERSTPGHIYRGTRRTTPGHPTGQVEQSTTDPAHHATNRTTPAQAQTDTEPPTPDQTHSGVQRTVPSATDGEAQQPAPGPAYSESGQATPGAIRHVMNQNVPSGAKQALGVRKQGGAQQGGAQHGGAQHGGAQHGGAQHGGAQHGGAQHGGAQHGGAQHGGNSWGGQTHDGAHPGGSSRNGYGGAGRGESGSAHGTAAWSDVRPAGLEAADEPLEWFRGQHGGSAPPR